MTRQEQIDAGKIWQAYRDGEPDEILFEGSKTAVFRWVSDNYTSRAYRTGKIRIGKLIWEREEEGRVLQAA